MSAYIRDMVGEDITVNMVAYAEGGQSYDNFKLVLVDYLTY
jgi:hypothetical protein